jgi:hypothetical protein
MSAPADFVACPHCGASIAPTAAACPECGSDEQTGWSEQRYLDGLGLPDADDDEYEAMREKEFGRSAGSRPHRPLWHIATAGALLLVVVWMLLTQVM